MSVCSLDVRSSFCFCACRSIQAFGRVAAGMGLKHSDKLVFGIMDGIRLSGFAETVNIYDGFPRMIVFVSSIPRNLTSKAVKSRARGPCLSNRGRITPDHALAFLGGIAEPGSDLSLAPCGPCTCTHHRVWGIRRKTAENDCGDPQSSRTGTPGACCPLVGFDSHRLDSGRPDGFSQPSANMQPTLCTCPRRSLRGRFGRM